MRLSMMPTAKKKLGGFALFSRQTESNGGGPGASLRSPAVGLPGMSGTAMPQQREMQLQPPPEIVTSRQDHPGPQPASLAVRSIPMPKSGRFASSPLQSATMSLPPTRQHFHPMQRTRTSASDTTPEPPQQQGQNGWEDSTVASMFDGSEGRPPSDRFRGRVPALAHHNRHFSDAPLQRTHPSSPPDRNHRQSAQGENLPFVMGDGGVLRVIQQPLIRGGPNNGAQSAPLSAGLVSEPPFKDDDLYQEAQQPPFETTPTKTKPLRHTRLPHRDPRESRRDSFGAQSSIAPSLDMSPERHVDAGPQQIERLMEAERRQERERRERDIQERELREREKQERERHEREKQQEERNRNRIRAPEHELHHKHAAVFDTFASAADEGAFDNTRAAVRAPESSQGSPSSNSIDEDALQRTPRPPQKSLPALPKGAIPGKSMNAFSFGGGSIAHNGSRRPKEKPVNDKKRPRELDYDDADLAKMSFADLKAQTFDYDPQKAALQQQQQLGTTPAGGTLEEKMEHYRPKSEMEQHEFFTRIKIDEWDEAGDWFLSQFTQVVERMRQARKAKRKIIEDFEGEIAVREGAVRGKIEGIEKTLVELKQEGQNMMQGKEAELEG